MAPTSEASHPAEVPQTTTETTYHTPLEAAIPDYYTPVVASYTPPLPSSRPGQVFHDDYIPQRTVDVITSDNIRPQIPYGDTFELVVTAAQNFGGNSGGSAAGRPPADVISGKPYVIPGKLLLYLYMLYLLLM